MKMENEHSERENWHQDRTLGFQVARAQHTQMLQQNPLEQGLKEATGSSDWDGIHDIITSVFNGVVSTRGKMNGK